MGNNNVLIGEGANSEFDGCVVIGHVSATKHNQLIIGTKEVSVTRDLTEEEFVEIRAVFASLDALVNRPAEAKQTAHEKDEMPSAKQALLEAPEGSLGDGAKETIKEWDEPPKALQVLKTLDNCVRFAEASEFVMQILNGLLQNAIKVEGTTYEAVVEQAIWRTHD